MTGRDIAWRAAGVVMILAGSASTAADLSVGTTLAGFVLAITGIVFAVQGKRVAVALRIERSHHRELPAVLHARRARRDPSR